MEAGTLGALGGSWLRRRAVAVLAVVVVAMLPPVAGTASPATDGRLASVIIQAQPGAVAAAIRQVEAFGGQVGRQLGIINGFSARVRPTWSAG